MGDLVVLALGDRSGQAQVRHVLQEMNLVIHEVPHGLQAIRDIASLIPSLVILDDTLPYLNGYQLCRLVKYGLHFNIPTVLLLSSHLSPDRFWGSSCGADLCLLKTDGSLEIKHALQKILAGKRTNKFFFRSPLIGQHTSDLDILKMANDLLDRHLFREKLINEITSLNRQVESLPQLVSVLMSLVGSLFPFKSAAVFLYYETKAELLVSLMEETSRQRLDLLYTSLIAHLKKEVNLNITLDDLPLTMLGPAQIMAESLSDSLKGDDNGDNDGDGDGEEISLFLQDNLQGVLCTMAFDGLSLDNYPEEEGKVFQIIIQKVIETLEEKSIFEKSIPFSIIDIVHRQAAHRSFFLKILAQNMDMARRFQVPLCLAFIELDNLQQSLKADTQWAEFHLRQKIHQTILNALRKMDIVARIGEYKYAVILYKANAEQARCVYQRVKMLLEDLSIAEQYMRVQGGCFSYEALFGLDAEQFFSTACTQIFSPKENETAEPTLSPEFQDLSSLFQLEPVIAQEGKDG